MNILKFEYHRLTWTEFDVLVDQNGTSVGYVDGLLCISNDFRIAGDIQFVGFLLAVDDGHHALSLVLAGNDIHTFLRTELGLLAFGDDLVALTPMQ